MRISHQKLGWAGAFAVAALVLAPAQAFAAASQSGCGKEFSKNAAKSATDAQKEIQKCVDGVQKVLDKGDLSKMPKQSDKCEASMIKIGGLGATDISADSKSKLGKGYAKIAGAVSGGKCTTAHVQAMGFPAGNAEKAARVLSAMALGQGYDTQLQTNGLSYAALVEAAESPGDVTGCPKCLQFVRIDGGGTPVGNAAGPCPRTACRQGLGTGITTQILGGNVPATVTFVGDVTLSACTLPAVFPSTTVVYSGNNSTNRATLTGGVTVCIDSYRTQGAIGSGAVELATDSCADHDPTVNSCSSYTNCTTGIDGDETCFDTTATAGGAGRGTVVLSTRLTVHAGLAGDGADNVLCTSDDTVAPGAPTDVALTTTVAEAHIFDGGLGGTSGVVNNSTTVTGAPFSNAHALSGGTLVGAFAAVDAEGTSALGDTLTDLTFVCL